MVRQPKQPLQSSAQPAPLDTSKLRKKKDKISEGFDLFVSQ